MKCYILDDQFGKIIYVWLKKLLPDLEYPIKENIKTPLDYLSLIEEKDIVLLDNFFPSASWWEEPLWETFLNEVLINNLSMKIISISDYGRELLSKFESWSMAYKKWIIIDFVSSKDPKDIYQILNKFLTI